MAGEDLSSEFNYAISYLQTIRNIEDECLRCAIKDDYMGWLKFIKALYRELHRRMQPEEIKKMEELIRQAGQTVTRRSLQSGTDHTKEEILSRSEIYLKDIIRKRGMDLPVKESPGDALSDDKGY